MLKTAVHFASKEAHLARRKTESCSYAFASPLSCSDLSGEALQLGQSFSGSSNIHKVDLVTLLRDLQQRVKHLTHELVVIFIC